jgi:hypothetical protein
MIIISRRTRGYFTAIDSNHLHSRARVNIPLKAPALAHPQMEETLHLCAIDGLAIREILLDRAILRLCVLDGGLHGSRKVLG